ncbi:MAG: hypothetical protein ACRDSN_18255 [Pseudonocardiaceae bacterium]
MERTDEPCHDLNKLDEWARALRYLWFKLSQQSPDEYACPEDAHGLDREAGTGGDEDVRRRHAIQALAAGAASVGGAAFAWFGAQRSARTGWRTSTGPISQQSSGAASVTWGRLVEAETVRATLAGHDRRLRPGQAVQPDPAGLHIGDQRKVDEACQVGSAALCIARDVRSVRTIADLADLSRRLAPFRTDPAVRMFDEQRRATDILVQRA